MLCCSLQFFECLGCVNSVLSDTSAVSFFCTKRIIRSFKSISPTSSHTFNDKNSLNMLQTYLYVYQQYVFLIFLKSELLSLGNWVIDVLYGACNTEQNCTEADLHKLVKNCFSMCKKSPTTLADYLQVNDLQELHQEWSTDDFFPLKFWGHCRLEYWDMREYEKVFWQEIYSNTKIYWIRHNRS